MPKSKSDISNSAIRIFLQRVGEFYDTERGLDKFVPTKSQKEELLKHFKSKCCYCGKAIAITNMALDHLVPMNKQSLGLHAWGNVVPCCKDCNAEKHQRNWLEYLATRADREVYKDRKQSINKYIKYLKYNPNLRLHDYAGNLYDDVGEVAMTLIELRLQQAKTEIKRLLEKS